MLFGGGISGCGQGNHHPNDSLPDGEPAVHQMMMSAAVDHGLPAHEKDGWVMVGDPALPLRVAALPPGDGEATAQLTAIARLTDGRFLIRPVIGYGSNEAEAMASAQADFLLGTFHTLIAAFCGDPNSQVDRVVKSVGGERRTLVLGNTISKTNAENPVIDHEPWRVWFFAALKDQSLPPGTHWIDLYHGYFGEQEALQIDLDNAPWPAMESAMQGAPWPKAGDFLGVRQLIIVDP